MITRIVFRAPILGTSGYSAISRKWVDALVALYDRSEIDLVLEPFIWHNDTYLPDRMRRTIERFAKKNDDQKNPLIRKESILVQVSLPFEYADSRLSGGFPVDGYAVSMGYTMLETDRVTPAWAVCCNWMDAVGVPTRFNVGTFSSSGVTVPVLALPPGVDFSCDGGNPSFDVCDQLKGTDDKKFNFLTIGQWSPPIGRSRKNFEEAVQAFCVAFHGRKDVGLIIKTCCSSPSPSDYALCVQKIKSAKKASGVPMADCPSVFLVYGTFTEGDIDYMYHKAHAFLLPTHGEGWGLNILQAVTHKLPVISTYWSSIPHILHRDYGWFLKPKIGPVDPTTAYYSRQAITDDHQWAEVDRDDLVSALREVEDNEDEAIARAEEQLKYLQSTSFSWVNSAQKLVNACVDLRRKKTKIITLSTVKTPDRVLVVMPMSFGDVHILTSLFPRISENFGGCLIDVMTKSRNFQLLKDDPLVGELIEYPDFWYAPLWRCRFDEMPVSKKLYEKYKVVYLPYYPTQIDFHKAPTWFDEKVHFLELYADACKVPRDKICRPFIRADITERVKAFPKNSCVMHPWAPDPAKRWSRFQGLADYLRTEGWTVIQVGGSEDPLLSNVLDARGLSFQELAALLMNTADVFVGTDSVCGHVASGIGIPTVSIFGSTVSSFSHPYWSANKVLEPKYPVRECTRGCHLFTCKYGDENKCIDLVPVADVRDAIRELTGR